MLQTAVFATKLDVTRGLLQDDDKLCFAPRRCGISVMRVIASCSWFRRSFGFFLTRQSTESGLGWFVFHFSIVHPKKGFCGAVSAFVSLRCHSFFGTFTWGKDTVAAGVLGAIKLTLELVRNSSIKLILE